MNILIKDTKYHRGALSDVTAKIDGLEYHLYGITVGNTWIIIDAFVVFRSQDNTYCGCEKIKIYNNLKEQIQNHILENCKLLEANSEHTRKDMGQDIPPV